LHPEDDAETFAAVNTDVPIAIFTDCVAAEKFIGRLMLAPVVATAGI
jgi:hypothetical protein